MIVLAAAEILAGIAGTGTAVTYTIFGMELASSVETYKTLAQGQLPTSAGTLYTTPSSTQTFIKSIHLANATGSAVAGVILYAKGTAAANQITGSFTIPINGWAVMEEDAWKIFDASGQIQYTGAARGSTPAVTFNATASAGVATTFVRTDDVLDAFDGVTPVNIAAAAVVGTNNFMARSDHTHTIGSGIVTRTMLEATGKNWQFLGQATASNAVRTGTITWTGTFKQLLFEYFIAGYNGAAIGRLIVGPTAGLSETGTTFCTSLIEGVTITATSVSVPGWPLAVTAAAVPRYGWLYVDNQAAVVKRMSGHGQHSGTAPTVVPTQMRMEGMFNDTTNLINKAELAVYAAITGTAISATTFNAGTYLNVWGRNDD